MLDSSSRAVNYGQEATIPRGTASCQPVYPGTCLVVIPMAQESHRRAFRAGIKIAFGTDAAVAPHGDNAREFAVYAGYGMRPADALRTATVNAADLLGVNDRGVIAPGRLADLIAVRGNPLEDVRVLEQVPWVMKGGVVMKSP